MRRRLPLNQPNIARLLKSTLIFCLLVNTGVPRFALKPIDALSFGGDSAKQSGLDAFSSVATIPSGIIKDLFSESSGNQGGKQLPADEDKIDDVYAVSPGGTYSPIKAVSSGNRQGFLSFADEACPGFSLCSKLASRTGPPREVMRQEICCRDNRFLLPRSALGEDASGIILPFAAV